MKHAVVFALLSVLFVPVSVNAKDADAIGVSWLEELEYVENGVAHALRSADPSGLRSGTISALKLISQSSEIREPGNVHCAMAAQSLSNFSRDVFMADRDRAKAAARGDFKDYREYLSDCEKAVGHKIKRTLQVRF